MCLYIQSGEEIKNSFRKWLEETSTEEGDIPASSIAEAWNIIAKKKKWIDRLVAIDDIYEVKK